MKDPLAQFRTPLKTMKDIEMRCACTDKIEKHLKQVKIGDWKVLYIYKPDGSYWVKVFPFGELQGGGPSCIILIDAEDPIAEFEAGVDVTSRIREEADRKEFWEVIGSEIGPGTCKAEGCSRKRVQFSVFCKRHHFENVRNEPCPF